MRLPHRSIKSIQPLPCILTAFPASNDNTPSSNSSNNSGINSGTCLLRRIEDGIEVVPLERSKTPFAPILSPDQVEKEVDDVLIKKNYLAVKPLPTPPRSFWRRMSRRQKIWTICGIQVTMLLTIGLALLPLRSHRSKNNNQIAVVQKTGEGSPLSNKTDADILQRGTFYVPINAPQQQTSACLANMNQSKAWHCASYEDFILTILPRPFDESDRTTATFGSPSGRGRLWYGQQAPEFQPSEISRLNNSDPADTSITFNFRTTYDRVVLLSYSELSTDKTASLPATNDGTFKPGDSIWRCVFKETLMQGYIYVHPSATSNLTSNATSKTNVTTTAADFPTVPYSFKLTEQHMSNGSQPYCEAMKVQQDGSLGPVLEKLQLTVSDPASAFLRKLKSRWLSRLFGKREMQSTKSCRCQWTYQ